MAIDYAGGNSTVSAKLKLACIGLVGLAVLLVSGPTAGWHLAPLLAWDAIALTFGVWTWVTIWPMDGKTTAAHAVREDPSRGVADASVLAATLASLIAIGVVLAAASSAHGAGKSLLAGLGIISVVASWATVHTLFTLHYAELYYRGTPGGVEFEGSSQPSYKDFAYLAFTMGMTFQVSDTGFTNTDFRRAALRHALLSYLFGTVIVATTINLIAGLSSQK